MEQNISTKLILKKYTITKLKNKDMIHLVQTIIISNLLFLIIY